ncbi:MAG: hypothetical protein K6U87_05615 [Firmicutes bacterium]|nr:hypothetical protein [Bacillota bacterium]
MYYGCDSGTDSVCDNETLFFYIGQLGYGTTVSSTYFNTSAANQAKQNQGLVYGYWFLLGPDSDPDYNGTSSEAYAWGQKQAHIAYNAWFNNPYVTQWTLFGDVEITSTSETNGWGTSTALNQKVWEGFYNQLSSEGLIPGVYSGPTLWQSIMGSGYNLNGVTPLWTSEPQESCGICPSNMANAQGFGNESPSVWQYNISNTCSVDLDCSSSLPS